MRSDRSQRTLTNWRPTWPSQPNAFGHWRGACTPKKTGGEPSATSHHKMLGSRPRGGDRILAFCIVLAAVQRGEIIRSPKRRGPMDDPITKAVEEFIASVPASKLEDKPLMQAFMNWMRSQDVTQDEMCVAICTLLGLFIGARAESKSHLKAGLATYG